jgi:hypothetical protein
MKPTVIALWKAVKLTKPTVKCLLEGSGRNETHGDSLTEGSDADTIYGDRPY